MAHFVFTDPFFSHNSVDLSDHVIGMSLEYSADAVDDTSAGDTTHLNLGGLLGYTLTVDLAQDLSSSCPSACSRRLSCGPLRASARLSLRRTTSRCCTATSSA